MAVYNPDFKTVRLENGLTMRYVQMGDLKGPVVILIHGATDSYFSYAQVGPYLAASGCRVYIPELRGHGGTDKPDSGPYTVAQHQQDLSGFMKQLKVSKAYLVGHSLGSFIAQETAILEPEKVVGLTLIGSGLKMVGNPTMNWILTGAGDDDFLGLASFTDSIPEDFMEDWVATSNEDPIFAAKALEQVKLLPLATWLNTFKGLEHADNSRRLGAVEAAVQIIWGSQDTFFTHNDQIQLIQALESSPLVVLITKKGAGHNTHWDKGLGKEISADIVGFLKMRGILAS